MIPNDWKIMSLGEICSNHLQTGPFGSQLHSHEYVENGIPVLMPKDLNDYRADLSSAAKITPEKANDLKVIETEPYNTNLIFGMDKNFYILSSVRFFVSELCQLPLKPKNEQK